MIQADKRERVRAMLLADASTHEIRSLTRMGYIQIIRILDEMIRLGEIKGCECGRRANHSGRCRKSFSYAELLARDKTRRVDVKSDRTRYGGSAKKARPAPLRWTSDFIKPPTLDQLRGGNARLARR